MSMTPEDQRKMEQLGLNRELLRKLDVESKDCPYDPNKGKIPTEQEKAEQARRVEALRRQAALNAMTADQVLPKGALIKINGRLFRVKASNKHQVRLEILPAQR